MKKYQNKLIQKQIEEQHGIYAKGMYTNKDKMMLLCVASRGEAIKIRRIATQIDEKAFIIISNAREVFGKGFKKQEIIMIHRRYIYD